MWAIALILAGLGVFFRVQQVLPQLTGLSQYSGIPWIIRICFYIIGIILIGGGIRKLFVHFKTATIGKNHDPSIDGME